ncbi:MAG: ribosome recycling factor, partial [Zetaproteobacteria bacterium]
VEYYGAKVPLKQVASITVPEPRLIVIQPWEKTMIPVIEKAIMESDLGLVPTNDGVVIRIQLPELTEERRRELVRQAHQLGERAKIALRNIRREANDEVKRRQREGEISEDEARRELERIQKITDKFVAKVDELVARKEKDILSV